MYNYRQESEECCDLNWAWHHVKGLVQLIYLLSGYVQEDFDIDVTGAIC